MDPDDIWIHFYIEQFHSLKTFYFIFLESTLQLLWWNILFKKNVYVYGIYPYLKGISYQLGKFWKVRKQNKKITTMKCYLCVITIINILSHFQLFVYIGKYTSYVAEIWNKIHIIVLLM